MVRIPYGWSQPTCPGRAQSPWTIRKPFSPGIFGGFPKYNCFGCSSTFLCPFISIHCQTSSMWFRLAQLTFLPSIANNFLLFSSCSQHTSPRCLPDWKPDHFQAHLSLMVLLRCLTICIHPMYSQPSGNHGGFLVSPLQTPGCISAYATTSSSHFTDSGILFSSLPPNTLRITPLHLLGVWKFPQSSCHMLLLSTGTHILHFLKWNFISILLLSGSWLSATSS